MEATQFSRQDSAREADVRSQMSSNYSDIKAYVENSYKISPTWFMSKTFGLCYMEKSPSWRYLFGVIHRASLTVLYVASIAYAIYKNAVLKNQDLTVISKIGIGMHLYGGIGVMISSYWQAWSKISQSNKLFHSLANIDTDIRKIFGDVVTVNQLKRDIHRFELTLNVAIGACLFGSVTYDIIVFKDYAGENMFAYYYAYIGPHFVAAIITSQFIYLVKLVQLRFNVLNQTLQYILSNCETVTTSTMDYGNPFQDRPIGASKSRTTIFIMNGVFQKRLSDSNSVVSGVHRVSHNNLRMMFELHNRLMDVAQNINKCYASALLVFVTGIFVFSIFGLFFETKVLFWSWEKSMKLILISTSPVLWVIAGLANVYVLLSVCEDARSAAYETPLIVHKIMQRKPLFMRHDDTYYNKMKAFTIQVLHRKKTFNFSALGLFNFDYTFIFSAVSAATSYLIVLLQFDVKF